jgi:aminomethyltransferase
MVVNGATKQGDMKHFDEQLKSFKGDASYEYFHELQLLALQVGGCGEPSDLVP